MTAVPNFRWLIASAIREGRIHGYDKLNEAYFVQTTPLVKLLGANADDRIVVACTKSGTFLLISVPTELFKFEQFLAEIKAVIAERSEDTLEDAR